MGLKFRRQRPLYHNSLGRETFFVADFYCHELKLVVEVDGEIHRRQSSEDAHRTRIINHLGIVVIRFKNEEVELHMKAVLSALAEIVTERSTPFDTEP